MNLSDQIIEKIIDEGVLINQRCNDSCSEFQIITSKFHEGTLILRWLEIDVSDIERPIQCYRYRCFNTDGSPQNCSIHYNNQDEANAFFKSLIIHYPEEPTSEYG